MTNVNDLLTTATSLNSLSTTYKTIEDGINDLIDTSNSSTVSVDYLEAQNGDLDDDTTATTCAEYGIV